MTAYRQRALACAAGLRAGPGRPRDLKEVAADAGRILLRNAYGWFERIEPGRYRLTGLGEAALGGALAAAAPAAPTRDHDAVRYSGGAHRT
jgi:hypothetical protein